MFNKEEAKSRIFIQLKRFEEDKNYLINIPSPEMNFAYPGERLESRIKYTDKNIDELVYKLYGLTDEEIKIVEGE